MKTLNLNAVDSTNPQALVLAARLAWSYATYGMRSAAPAEQRGLIQRACAFAHAASRACAGAACPSLLYRVRVLRGMWGIGQLGVAEWEIEVDALLAA